MRLGWGSQKGEVDQDHWGGGGSPWSSRLLPKRMKTSPTPARNDSIQGGTPRATNPLGSFCWRWGGAESKERQL